MTGCLFALLAALLAGLGARDQMLVANLSARWGPRPALLATAIATGALASGLAAWATREVATGLPHAACLLVAAISLVAAGADSLLLGPGKPPKEPTNSLGAAAIVLFADQITDSARCLILAVALASEQPLSAGVGGAVGGAAALVLGGMQARWLVDAGPWLKAIRRGAGVVLLLAGGTLVARLSAAL